MAQRRARTHASASELERIGEPLFATPFDDEGKDIRYFWTEEESDAAVTDEMIQRTLAAVASPVDPDFDWEKFDDAMERIGHETPPTPPIEADRRVEDRLNTAAGGWSR